MTVRVRFLVFTLGTTGAIADAHICFKPSVLTLVLFVVLAQILPFAILALASSSSRRSAAILDGLVRLLQRNQRVITVIFGLIFGTWFLLKAAARLGMI